MLTANATVAGHRPPWLTLGRADVLRRQSETFCETTATQTPLRFLGVELGRCNDDSTLVAAAGYVAGKHRAPRRKSIQYEKKRSNVVVSKHVNFVDWSL